MNVQVQHAQQQLVIETFHSSFIDYAGAYLHLYASYNAWYRFATGHSLDTLALAAMKQRYEIWKDFLDGECLERLRSPMRRLYVLSQHRPLLTSSGVHVQLEDDSDWVHLIDVWYAIRCDIVHATPSRTEVYFEQFVRLAYESLQIYMTEVVARLQRQSQSARMTSIEGRREYIRLPEPAFVDRVPSSRFDSRDISLRSERNTV